MHGENGERRQLIEPEPLHDQIGQPLRGLGLQQRGTEADADAEQHDRSPRNQRVCGLPVHHADAGQEKQGNRYGGRGRTVKGMQHALGRPEAKQDQRDRQQARLLARHRAEFGQRFLHAGLAAGNFLQLPAASSSS